MERRTEDALREAIAAGPASRFVAMFGSCARGESRADSDLDLAWLPVEPDLSLGAELALQAALTGAAGREVDLVRVDQASTVARMEIARDGVLLAGDRAAFDRFRAAAALEYIDFAPALRAGTERYRRRLAAGSPQVGP